MGLSSVINLDLFPSRERVLTHDRLGVGSFSILNFFEGVLEEDVLGDDCLGLGSLGTLKLFERLFGVGFSFIIDLFVVLDLLPSYGRVFFGVGSLAIMNAFESALEVDGFGVGSFTVINLFARAFEVDGLVP